MSKECEYRAYAGACVDLANKATNDDDRKHLLAMAEAWLGLMIALSGRATNPMHVRCIPLFGQSLGMRFKFPALHKAR
jgi:hypothetical protein